MRPGIMVDVEQRSATVRRITRNLVEVSHGSVPSTKPWTEYGHPLVLVGHRTARRSRDLSLVKVGPDGVRSEIYCYYARTAVIARVALFRWKAVASVCQAVHKQPLCV